MGFDNNEKITRRKFIKGVAGAAVCCAYFSLDRPAASQENSEQDGEAKVHLAAACGTYCGACPAYIAKHGEDEQIDMEMQKSFSSGPMKETKTIPDPSWMDGLLCDGCLSGGILAAHCQICSIRLCAKNTQNDSRCTDCEELPCYRITNLINMDGGYLHRKEYLPNLEKMREMGVEEWVIYEEERWRCPQCGLPMSWYDAECRGCGEPRSVDLFSLSDVDINEWVEINGNIYYEGSPLCALILASGQYMFTCDPDNRGVYELEVPLNKEGKITLFGFCSQLEPFEVILTPEQAKDFDIEMTTAPVGSPEMTVTVESEPGINNPDWVRISGTVTYNDGTPLCAMVLASGQYMFTCTDPIGSYDMEVPVNGEGKILLYVFCSGMVPYQYLFRPAID